MGKGKASFIRIYGYTIFALGSILVLILVFMQTNESSRFRQILVNIRFLMNYIHKVCIFCRYSDFGGSFNENLNKMGNFNAVWQPCRN
ncbi:MAG TPA: hypothetical protein DCM62_07140 [Bacteroidales bacterium]|nr:hypothetical protein [Bacteroidales bacterium]